MRGKANSVEEAKRFISNNHGPEPRYIKEDKEQDGKIWLSNQLGDPIGFYEPATKTVKMVDKKTTDADIKFVNKGSKFITKNGSFVEILSDVNKNNEILFRVKSKYQSLPIASLKVRELIDFLNSNGYAPTKDAAYFDPMYKDTRRAVVREAENYLRSKGLNNSVGKYDKAIFGVRSLLEKTLLQPGTDKFNDAVHREVDRLLKKYNLTKDSTEVLQSKNGYTLGVNNGKLVLAFKGETLEHPHMWLGDAKNAKNMKQAVDLFEEFASGKKVKDSANGSVDDYLKKMNNKTQAEVEKILRQAKGNPNADKAYRIWKSTIKDAKMPVPGNHFMKGDKVQYGNRKGIVKNAYGDVVVVQLEGDPKGDYSHLSYYTVKYAKDSEMEKTYSYSIKIGGDLKRVRVKADNSTEALEKVKKEAIKFKGERVKTKWDNNKLSTRDQD